MQRFLKKYWLTLFYPLALATACQREPEKQSNRQTASSPGTRNPEAQNGDDFLIRKGATGTVYLGAEVEKVTGHFPARRLRKQEVLLEGVAYTQYILLDQGGKPELVLEPTCTDSCRISRITVLSNAYRTAEKLGVGSTVSDLRKVYPSREVFVEEGNVVIRIEEAGISFLLDPADVPQDWFAQPEPNSLPAKAKVLKVLLTEPQPVKSTKP